MTGKVTGKVWESGLYNGAALLVALKLGDNADDAGWCWPSVSTLARYTGLSARAVRREIARMEAEGVLKRDVGRGRGRVNRYGLNLRLLDAAAACWAEMVEAAKAAEVRDYVRPASLEKMTQSPLFARVKEDTESAFWAVKADSVSGYRGVKPDSESLKPDSSDTKTGLGSPPEPSGTIKNSACAWDGEQWAEARRRLRSRAGDRWPDLACLRLSDGVLTAPSVANVERMRTALGRLLGEEGVTAIFAENEQREVRL